MKINRVYYQVKGNVDKRIVLLSDIHYYSKKDNKKLNRILDNLNNIDYDYLCITGDLIDERNIHDEEYLITFLKKLAKKSKIIISLGNHEYINGKDYSNYNKVLFNNINKIRNVSVLDNDILNIDNINFIGLTLPGEYYYKYNEHNDNYLIDYINKHIPFLKSGYNILLCHTPIRITKSKVFNKLNIANNIDLVLSGHTHGGITPSILKKVLKGRGLIGPQIGILVKHSYGKYTINKTNFIISSGITKSSHANKLSFLDFLFAPEITIIDIKSVDVC